jgi:hypothetical protein
MRSTVGALGALPPVPDRPSFTPYLLMSRHRHGSGGDLVKSSDRNRPYENIRKLVAD